MAATHGVDATHDIGVHTIALKIPKTQLTSNGGNPTNKMSASSVIGVWASASRQKSTVLQGDGTSQETGPWVQVSRLGNPLFNEVIVPMGEKDGWNAAAPAGDSEYLKFVQQPELAKLLPNLYPNVFPNLAGLKANRADLVAILLTGIPSGIVPGFQNFTGSTLADQLRLNMAIPPTAKPRALGLIGGDPAGFPNGRRVFDDVVTVELRAIAGVTYPLVNPSYTPDAAAKAIDDGIARSNTSYLSTFPYLGTPISGFDARPLSMAAAS